MSPTTSSTRQFRSASWDSCSPSPSTLLPPRHRRSGLRRARRTRGPGRTGSPSHRGALPGGHRCRHPPPAREVRGVIGGAFLTAGLLSGGASSRASQRVVHPRGGGHRRSPALPRSTSASCPWSPRSWGLCAWSVGAAEDLRVVGAISAIGTRRPPVAQRQGRRQRVDRPERPQRRSVDIA